MKDNVQKNLKFSLGIFDQISNQIKNKIAEESKSCQTYGVGVYTDKFIIDNFMTYPSKSLDERLKMVQDIDGVDFTFAVDTSDIASVKEKIKIAYDDYLKNSNKNN